MKKLKWKTNVKSRDKQDARVARRLQRMAMKLYKYAAKHALRHVEITVLNNNGVDNDTLPSDCDCYVAVRAKYYDFEQVDDYIFMPMIEEEN